MNPPWVFDLLLGVMRPFIDAKTMAKVKIVRPAKGGLAAELAAFGVTDAAQLAWLEAAVELSPAEPGNLPDFASLRVVVPREMRLPHADKLLGGGEEEAGGGGGEAARA